MVHAVLLQSRERSDRGQLTSVLDTWALFARIDTSADNSYSRDNEQGGV